VQSVRTGGQRGGRWSGASWYQSRQSSLIRQMSPQIACSRLTSPRREWVTGETNASITSQRISAVQSKQCSKIARVGGAYRSKIRKLDSCRAKQMSSCTKVSKKLSVCHGSNFTFLGWRSGRHSPIFRHEVGQGKSKQVNYYQSKIF